MSHVQELSFTASLGGTSQKVAFSATSAASTELGSGTGGSMTVLVTTDLDCFVRQGTNPTALSDGTDQFITANAIYRISVQRGNKLAFIGAAAGNAYITPEN